MKKGRKQKAEREHSQAESNVHNAGGLPTAYSRLPTVLYEPNIYLYDKYPGGVGFSEPLFRMNANLLANTKKLIENCPCLSGCPSCVGPPGEVGEKGKSVALMILEKLIRAGSQ